MIEESGRRGGYDDERITEREIIYDTPRMKKRVYYDR